MKLSRALHYHPLLFNVIPLVNVLFLLLIFFALSSTFVLQPGVAVTPPFSSFTLSPRHHPQIVSVTAGIESAIYFRDEKVTLPLLAERLRDARMRDRTLIVRADRSAPYDLVAQVMNTGLTAGLDVVLAASPSSQP